jgi:hypothetical protein
MESNTAISTNEDTACDTCGNFGALEIADRLLCPDCVALAGCGCGGSAAVNDET